MPFRRMPSTQLIVADLPRRTTILDPILASNSQALLYGPRGLGKTFLAMSIAWAVASGASFLGWRAERPRRVLYVDGEMAAIDMQERLKLLGSAPATLEFMLAGTERGSLPDLATPRGQIELAEAWGRPELVVLDNLSSLVGLKSGNSEAWDNMQRFLMLQRSFNRAVLMVHHANKRGEQRGTNRREDVLDLVMAMRRPDDYEPRQGARFEIHFEKARGLLGDAVEPIEARLETDSLGVARWSWRPAVESEMHRFKELLEEGLNPNQIAREMGISKSKAYRLKETVGAATT